MTKLHVSISAEPLFRLGNIDITNSMLTGIAVSVFLVGFSFWLSRNLKLSKSVKGVQNVAEMIIESLYNLMVSVAGEAKTKEFFPLIATFFLYILFSNWLELLPGVGTIGIMGMDHEGKTLFAPLVRPPSADFNATLGLALISVSMIQIVGFKHLSFAYFQRFINFKNPMKFVMGLLDIISELSKIISFAFRLFGNIFAGEVLLAVSLALIPFLAPLPFMGLEIFIGLIQALVFAILTLVFMNTATLPHEEEH